MEEQTQEEVKKPKAPVFKLHFGPKTLLGKSYVRTRLPLKTPHTVTGKFYREDENADQKAVEVRCEKLRVPGPRDKYRSSVTENQRYGWCEPFSDTDRTDRRLHFAKRHDHVVKLHLQTADHKNK